MILLQIPVYLGSEEALVLPFRHGDIFHGHDGFNGLEFDSDPDVSKVNEELAAVAIGKIINQYPGAQQAHSDRLINALYTCAHNMSDT